MSSSFVCKTCGQEHPGLPTDYSFGLPDDVFGLKFIDRYLRSRSNSDLCTLDDSRYFIRGVIPIPFRDVEDTFCWGVWIEVSREDHDRYVAGYYDDLSGEPSFSGTLANEIPGYGGTTGMVVTAKYGAAGQRPSYFLNSAALGQLAADQHDGITAERHHAMLDSCGHFDKAGVA